MNNNIQELAMNIENWIPIRQANIPGMNYQVLTRLLRLRHTDPKMAKCVCEIGNRIFVNKHLLGLWMAGEL
ncbi:hypothetical protein ACK31E_15560 [Aeromonas caviae]|uniref:hypothetical protein n=1 Tax=Aeromonas allosaccharophila TaxID=656 RepID=UPI00100839A4|nr:hypothetical protein [Aeromonas allosaccharophila]